MARTLLPEAAAPGTTAASPSPGVGAERAGPARVLLLVNPHSRRGADCLHDVLQALQGRGITVVVETFSAAREVSADIRRRAGEVDAVVVCGGDGTVNAALPGILETGLPLGVAPCGTANDFARTLGLPQDPVAAMDAISGGLTRRTERCVDFEVSTRKPRSVNADGEIVATTPARFSILPQAIRVFAP
ncbi:MAG: diacylglycerol kinase family protein [Salinarimonas sp.]